MKNTVLLSFLSLALLFSACQKEELPTESNEVSITMTEQMLTLAELEAQVAAGKMTDTPPQGLTGLEDNCSCFYEFVGSNLTPIQGFPRQYLEYIINGVCPDGCNYRSLFQNTSDDQSCNPGGCFINEPNFPPAGLQPFNCLIPRNDQFDIDFLATSTLINSCAVGFPMEEATLTFRIHCLDHANGPNCDQLIYSSEEITINAVPDINTNIGIKLTGCGCLPQALNAGPGLQDN